MVNLMESRIPEIYTRRLDEDKQIVFGANHTEKIVSVLFEAVSRCLSDVKSKEYPVAFSFEDLVGDTIACAVIEYHKNDDDTQPGNWSYVWSFDKSIIPDGARVLKISDSQAQQYFISVAGSKYHMGFEGSGFIIELMNVFLQTLSKYLEENATSEENNTVILDGVFQARADIKGDVVVKSIEVIGETKKIIKTDEDIEVE